MEIEITNERRNRSKDRRKRHGRIHGSEREVGSVRSLIIRLLSVAAEPPGAASLRHGRRGQECIYNTAGSDDTDLMRRPGTAQEEARLAEAPRLSLCASCPPPTSCPSIPQNKPTSTSLILTSLCSKTCYSASWLSLLKYILVFHVDRYRGGSA